jgi:hypothetical protein
MDHSGSAVCGVILSFDHAFLFETVDRGRHRPAGQTDQTANFVHGERSFMQEHFQGGEVGESDPEGMDVALGVAAHRLVRFH